MHTQPQTTQGEAAEMGTGTCGKKARHSAKKKQYKKALCTKRRPKDIDQIQVGGGWVRGWGWAGLDRSWVGKRSWPVGYWNEGGPRSIN